MHAYVENLLYNALFVAEFRLARRRGDEGLRYRK